MTPQYDIRNGRHTQCTRIERLIAVRSDIGNGPNFMVRAIAEKLGVRMPSSFGYAGYSCVFPLPVLAMVAWLFL